MDYGNLNTKTTKQLVLDLVMFYGAMSIPEKDRKCKDFLVHFDSFGCYFGQYYFCEERQEKETSHLNIILFIPLSDLYENMQ